MAFTLWPACVKTHAFPDQLAAAAAAGCDTLPIGLLTYRGLREAGHTPADVRRMAADAGVSLGHYDGFSAWAPYPFAADLPAAARAVFAAGADECLRICAELELPAVCCTGVYDPEAAEMPRLVEAFAGFCDRAAAQGVQVDLEFIPMWAVSDLASAWDIVAGAGRDNAAVMVDSWHFFRGNPDLELLAALPPGSVRTVQLADAPGRAQGVGLLEECLTLRRLPGDGDLPLREFVDLLARKGGVTNIGPEVFADELDRLPAADAALRAAGACRELLAGSPLAPVQPHSVNVAAAPPAEFNPRRITP